MYILCGYRAKNFHCFSNNLWPKWLLIIQIIIMLCLWEPSLIPAGVMTCRECPSSLGSLGIYRFVFIDFVTIQSCRLCIILIGINLKKNLNFTTALLFITSHCIEIWKDTSSHNLDNEFYCLWSQICHLVWIPRQICNTFPGTDTILLWSVPDRVTCTIYVTIHVFVWIKKKLSKRE